MDFVLGVVDLLDEFFRKLQPRKELALIVDCLQNYSVRKPKVICKEESYALTIRRMIDPESVFGEMKNNRG